MFALLALSVLGCSEPSNGHINGVPASQVTVKPAVFDAAKATARADSYIDTLYGSKSPRGPVCMPEAVTGDYTQCSYTYTELNGTLVAGTILCSNKGCMEGEAPKIVDKQDMPAVTVVNGQSNNGLTDDWLFWYLMFNNGGTSYRYNSWYDSTPAYGRTSYYSPTYVPSAQSRSYYTSTYKAPVASTSTTKYATKTTPTVTKTTTTTTTKTPTSTTSSTVTKSTTTTSTPAATTTKSSGYGKSTRSSGYSSGSSSRSSSRSGRR